MFEELKKTLRAKMDDTQGVFESHLRGIRAGRAQTGLLDNLKVDAYGSKMPINQLASVSVQGPSALAVQVWDAQMVSIVDKSIRDSGLGLNPMVTGTTLKIMLPELTTERRAELIKQVATHAEEARVSVRAIRRHGMDALKKAEKDKELSEDEVHKNSTTVQKLTDAAIGKIDAAMQAKEKDLLKV
jgi:ribosome recycling factor